jgi:hypothetical protein
LEGAENGKNGDSTRLFANCTIGVDKQSKVKCFFQIGGKVVFFGYAVFTCLKIKRIRYLSKIPRILFIVRIDGVPIGNKTLAKRLLELKDFQNICVF